MLSSLKYDDAKREDGFTLIELLVVVIIIGILAAIAIPIFLRQRESAWRSATETDVRNAAVQVESFYTAARAYPTVAEFNGGSVSIGDSPFALVTGGQTVGEVTVSGDVTLTYAPVLNGTAVTGYTITGTHAQLDAGYSVLYDSTLGGIQP